MIVLFTVLSRIKLRIPLEGTYSVTTAREIMKSRCGGYALSVARDVKKETERRSVEELLKFQ